MSFNQITLLGNLTRDPETKFLESGTAVCNFAVACNERYTDRDGETQERAMFVDCVAWSRTGEIIGEHFVKGQQILVNGKLQFDQWEDEDGNNRSRHKVNVFSFAFTGTKADNEKLRDNRGDDGDGDEENEDDIPF